jgi:hypothetical protein
MKLFEHPDFEQAGLQASDHYRGRGLRPALIEKDYYVTEALIVHVQTDIIKTRPPKTARFAFTCAPWLSYCLRWLDSTKARLYLTAGLLCRS